MRFFRALAFVLVGFLTFPAARAVKQHFKPAPVSKPSFAYREMAQRELAAKVPCRVLFLGDSIVDCLDDLPEWYTDLAPRGCVNLGLSWDGTADLSRRIDSGHIDGMNPDTVVLLIGTNDFALERPAPSADELANRIRRIVFRVRKRVPDARIVVTGILPRFDEPDGSTFIKETNDKLALSDGFAFIDIGSELLVNGKVDATMQPDGVHLSPAGYRVWLKSLKPFID